MIIHRPAHNHSERLCGFALMRSLTVLLLLLLSLDIAAQVDFNALNAEEAFREGVVRFHRASYNEAILNFQRSLSFVPDDPQVREWLGRAYYFSGFEQAALNEWQRLEDQGQAPPYLRAFIDHMLARQSLAEELQEDRQFLVVEQFEAEEYVNTMRFPGGIIPDGRGRIILNSFGSNNLGLINQSGRLLVNLNGGFSPLSGPFDSARHGEELFVTNFLGDFISVLDLEGDTIRQFGESGIGPGQLLGPQYISVSDEPAVYVSDFGNQRVVKYTPEGQYLFHFGEPAAFRRGASSTGFPGFTRIAGLSASSGGIYVGDNIDDQALIYHFDPSGNLLERFELPGVSDLEDISPGLEGRLLLTSRRAVYSFDPVNLLLRPLHRAGDRDNAQYVSAAYDDNRNLLISDFRNSRVLYLSRLSGLYSGYQVEILRVEAADFPRVLVEVSVRDILGNDVLGLEEENFVLTEEGLEFENWQLDYSGSFDEFTTAAMIIEASERWQDDGFAARQRNGVQQALQNLPDQSVVRIFSAGLSPVLEWNRGDDEADVPAVLRGISGDGQWRLDQAIRLAGDRLLLDQAKREILFIGSGNLPDWAFETIGLNQTLAYLRNNQIRFNLVHSSTDPIDPALSYLIDQTGGNVYTLFEAEGMVELGQDFLDRRTGIYLLSTNSLFDPDFGRKYLPIEVEVSHFTKSGRDESGYFAPLEF
jgi:hypothetical protein